MTGRIFDFGEMAARFAGTTIFDEPLMSDDAFDADEVLRLIAGRARPGVHYYTTAAKPARRYIGPICYDRPNTGTLLALGPGD